MNSLEGPSFAILTSITGVTRASRASSPSLLYENLVQFLDIPVKYFIAR